MVFHKTGHFCTDTNCYCWLIDWLINIPTTHAMLHIISARDTTWLPSNLRPITSECMHLVRRGHFWSHDKDGGHKIQSTIAENPIVHANFMALCFTEEELLQMEVLHCRNSDFRPFLLLWPWPWPDDLHIWTWPVLCGDIPDVLIWTSYTKAFKS